jgi:fatty-acyl-CoA synthase
VYPGSECVTWTGSGTRRASYAEVARNAARLAGALTRLGIGPNDPVATFAWNNQEHLEAYFGVPSMGAVLHTLNIRLPGAQVAQIVNHAGDRVIILDDTLVPLLARIAGELTTVEAFIVNGTGDAAALGDRVPVLRYHELLAAEQPDYAWPEPGERDAALMCYTSVNHRGSGAGVPHWSTTCTLCRMAASAWAPRRPAGLASGASCPRQRVRGCRSLFPSGATLQMPGPFPKPST